MPLFPRSLHGMVVANYNCQQAWNAKPALVSISEKHEILKKKSWQAGAHSLS
jgi:hypothetical protein